MPQLIDARLNGERSLIAEKFRTHSAEAPEVAPTALDWYMTSYVGIAAGCFCALIVVAILAVCVAYRKRRRKAKVRRHVNMMQVSS